MVDQIGAGPLHARRVDGQPLYDLLQIQYQTAVAAGRRAGIPTQQGARL